MNTIQKRVRLYLTERMLNVYNYCVAEQQTLGKMLIEYLDLQYGYKYLIQQHNRGGTLSRFNNNNDAVYNEKALTFDYDKKQRLLASLSQELKHEYNYLLALVKGEDRQENDYCVEDNRQESINHSHPLEVKQQQKQDEAEGEEEDEYNSEYEKAKRESREPDPNNPGFSKDGLLLW